VLFINIDHFKTINDSLGYAAGDQLLRAVAERLRGSLDELDTLARLGADEFAVLVEDRAAGQQLASVAQAVLDTFEGQFQAAGQEVYLSASVGVSCFPEDGEDEQSLLSHADAAVHRAKERGRNQYCFFASELNALAREALTLKSSLRQAIEKREFLLYYQPRVCPATGKLHGAEALIRWRHPVLGMVPPSKFIPVAEQSGIIEAIGEWVLETACAQGAAWAAAGYPPFRLAVNLSLRQLINRDFEQSVAGVLARTGIDAQMLELEITESVLMEDPAGAMNMLRKLRGLGIRVALDDFGTEYSSLAYLKHFPLDYMKIDQSFVRGIPEDRDDVAITRTVLALARNLGLGVIAEGVETEAQWEFLKGLGCDEIQGYFVSRPLPVEDFDRFMAGRARALD
jgi:diguanylate cyclase (GGDEF)-like protein